MNKFSVRPSVNAVLIMTILNFLAPSSGQAHVLCDNLLTFQSGVHPLKSDELKWLDEISKPLKPGQVGPRLLTKESVEVPDPEKPLPLILPSGEKKYAIGVSGQHLLLVDSPEALAAGGLKTLSDMHFFNRHGFRYGAEVDHASGEPVPYVWNSSLWDGAFAYRHNPQGEKALVIFGGGMADNPETGKPYMMADGKNNTRQRLFFDGDFFEYPSGSGKYVLTGFNPRTPLNEEAPDVDQWVKEKEGKTVFRHGYGGAPVTLLNGDLYVDQRGRVPMIFEAVVDQKKAPDPDKEGKFTYSPGRTAIMIAYLDESLTTVLEKPKIILDVFKDDGSVFEKAERKSGGYGPLVEGGHVTVLNGHVPISSREELERLRLSGGAENFEMYFSMGEYYGNYGSYRAVSEKSIEAMRPVLDNSTGEPQDITAPLRVLFTWLGRPAPYFTHVQVQRGLGGQKNLLIHGVARAWLPPGILLDTLPLQNQWPAFRRQVITVPIESYQEDGVWKERIKDNTGLLEWLTKFRPRPLS